MASDPQFDFWYAVQNTEVVRLPPRKLETFGTTLLNYRLLSELMDSTDKVRIREGRIEAFRPQIVTPAAYMESLLEGFGGEAEDYVEWLRKNQSQLHFLKYGFQVRKQEVNSHIVSDSLPQVIERVQKEAEEKDDPFSAIAVGVEEPWEVCLLKLMVDVIEHSVSSNVHDLAGKNLFEKARKDPTGIHGRIEILFREAAADRSKLDALQKVLKEANLFSQYEDRFFALVRKHQ